MTPLKALLYALPLSLLLTACGDDSDDPIITPTPDSDTPAVVNDNRNDASLQPELAQLEFPRAKGGTSDVIVHSTTGYGMTYALEWDHALKAQRWTCYRLDRRTFAKNGNTRKSLWPDGDPWGYDPSVPQQEQSATYSELSKSYYPGTTDAYYEKGHICPSVDRIYTKDANEQTFFMTNIMPQVGKFNGGIWEEMETQVRRFCGNADAGTWFGSVDTLYVCKGGTIDKEEWILNRTIGGHIAPRFFFMALLAKVGTTYKAMAFWVEHLNEDHSADSLGDYVISVRELEQKTGIDFFCNLPDDVEEAVETAPVATVRQQWNL